MKYILMMSGTEADFEGYLKWSEDDVKRNIEFMRDFAAALRSEGVLISTATSDAMVAVIYRSGRLYVSPGDGATWSFPLDRLPVPSGLHIC